MINSKSTSAAAEDLIRAITQLSATELHLVTLLKEENSLLQYNDPNKSVDRLNIVNDLLDKTTSLRRKSMNKLLDIYPDGYKKLWCCMKHLGAANSCLFESYQALEDPEIYDLSIEADEIFTTTTTALLGMEITPCAACFGDMLKEKEFKNE